MKRASSDAHRSGETGVYLSSSNFVPRLVRVNLDETGIGGIILNYRDGSHYVVAGFDKHVFSLGEVVVGKWNRVRQHSFPVPHFKAKSMVVMEFNGRLCVLVDDVAIMMEGPYAISGRIGVDVGNSTVKTPVPVKIDVVESPRPSGLFELVHK